MQKNYELIVFLKPTLSEEEIKAATERVKGMISADGGSVYEEKEPEKQKLQFMIDKFSDGFHWFLRFKFEPSKVAELNGKLKIAEELLRYMISIETIREEPKKKERPKKAEDEVKAEPKPEPKPEANAEPEEKKEAVETGEGAEAQK